MRVYVTGRLSVEHGDARVEAGDLPGRQGRLALAFLVLERSRPVPRDELVDALWADTAPKSVDAALSAVVSKLRAALATVELDGATTLRNVAGCYELRLPPATVVDVETAANSLDRAEGALRAGELAQAWSGATVAAAILRRPLLPGDDAPWVQLRRRDQANTLVRAYDCLVEVWLRRGDTTLAVELAREALRLAPFRESGHRRLMRAHAAAGDRAEALRVYEALRLLLSDELGVSPSAETEKAYLDLLT